MRKYAPCIQYFEYSVCSILILTLAMSTSVLMHLHFIAYYLPIFIIKSSYTPGNYINGEGEIVAQTCNPSTWDGNRV